MEIKSYTELEFTTLTNLYVQYLNLLLNTVNFTFAIVGAVVVYTLKNENTKYQRYGILLPTILCLGMAIFFFMVIPNACHLHDGIKNAGRMLHMQTLPHSQTLIMALAGLGSLELIVGIALILLYRKLRAKAE